MPGNPEIKSWTVLYENPLTGLQLKTAVFAPDLGAAVEKARAENVTAGPYGPPWKILDVSETIFPAPEPEARQPAEKPAPDDGIRSETFYDYDEAMACAAAHPDSDIYAHPGHPIVLDGRMAYDIPENQPHWTVVWEEDPAPGTGKEQ